MHELIERSIKAFSEYFQNFFLYEPEVSLLSKTDPRVKVAGFTLLTILSVATFEIEKVLFVLAAVYSLAAVSGIKITSLLRRSYLFAAFSFVVVLPTLALGESLHYVLTFTLRVFSAISSLQLLIMTTPFNQLVSALRSMRFPEKLLTTLWITYVYSYMLTKDLLATLLARESRRVRKSGHIETMKKGGEALGLFLLRSMEKGEKVAMAMRIRGDPVARVEGSKLLILYFTAVVIWWAML